MTGRPLLLGLFLSASCWALAVGDESPPKAESPSATKAESSGRLDREKLTQLRERLGGVQADLARLKRMTWKVGDATREALVYVPAELNKDARPPLVFAFHGHGGRAEYAARKLAIHQHWPEAICVYPQGLPTPVPVIDAAGKRPGWQKFSGDQQDRDLLFFDALLESMQADYHIDENRVYSTGHSNGGYFTYVLWAARGDALAAVAPIAAAASPRDFRKQKPKPVLHIAGEKDQIVRFATQQRTMTQVRTLNGCDAEGKPAGKLCTEYSSKDGPPVVTFIHPGGHEIPEQAPQRIAEFFQGHAKK